MLDFEELHYMMSDMLDDHWDGGEYYGEEEGDNN